MEQPGSIERAPGAPGTGEPRVLYIMGAGRSGSTILGVALGNCQGVFFAGELDKWLAQSGVPSYATPERERFWAGVLDELPSAAPLFGFKTRVLERSSTIFSRSKWMARRALRGEYRRVAQELYAAIARATGAQLIVDSSHYPLRAKELQAVPGIELYLLYLVRDPHSVVRSLSRKDVPERSFGTLASNAYLSLTHLFALPVFLRQPRSRRLFVRHEDFRADPRGVIEQILRHAGSHAEVPELSSLETGVPFHGNRLVARPSVSLEGEERRDGERSPLTTLMQLPWTMAFRLLRPAAAPGGSPRTAGSAEPAVGATRGA